MIRLPLAVFWRSWLLDASWHPQRMQGASFLYALLPVLRRSPDPADGVRRHNVAFGTNVYVAPAVIGAVARLELDGQGAAAARVRDWLAAPFSGAADLFYWGALRPALLALALLCVVAGEAGVGLTVFLVLFNGVATWNRWRSFTHGAEAGAELLRQRERARPPRSWTAPLHHGLLALAVALPVCTAVRARAGASTLFDMGLALAVGYYAARRRVSPGIAFLGLVALGVVARRLELPASWIR